MLNKQQLVSDFVIDIPPIDIPPIDIPELDLEIDLEAAAKRFRGKDRIK